MIITNFKTYESATGDAALTLAKIHDEVAQETGADIRIAVQATDLYRIASAVSIPVYAQHIDPVSFGGNTGHILPEAVKAAGAQGTLLNHSERRLDKATIAASISRAKELGLEVILCAATPEEGEAFVSLDPTLIAVEPPELIGGDISVSTAQPEIVSDSAARIPGKCLVGAGVKNGEDVKKSLELGAQGVLLASGVTKTENPQAILYDLISGLADLN